MVAEKYFSTAQQDVIVKAIQRAEKNTSGEIRVHIDMECNSDVLDAAAWWFEKLKMHRTALRNGVLIYLAIKSHKFAIIGDAGINAVVSSDFWEETKNGMLKEFKENRYTEGLVYGIEEAGLLLKKSFPYQSDDRNELPNEISFGSDKKTK